MKRVIYIACFFIVTIAGVVLATRLGLQKPDTTLLPDFGVSLQVTAEINKYISTKIVTTDKKVTIYIPANSIKEEGSISLTTMQSNLFTDIHGEWDRPIVVNLDVYSPSGIIVHGPTINRNLDICFMLSEEESAGFLENREDYYIQYYKEKEGEDVWEKIEYSSKTDSRQICGEINHLTLFSLAIRREVRTIIPLEEPYLTP